MSKSCYCGQPGRKHHLGVCAACYRAQQYWTAPGRREESQLLCQHYYYRNHARERARCDAYKMRNKDKLYLSRAKSTYGLSAEDYYALHALQGGRCAICRTPSEKLGERMAIDHCHDSGMVRGLLCKPCNQGLGWHQKRNTGAYSWYLNFPPMQKLLRLRDLSHEDKQHWNW